ncbi:MAG: hypothetical protein ACYDBQ_09045 [Thermoplasmatota archaeon]
MAAWTAVTCTILLLAGCQAPPGVTGSPQATLPGATSGAAAGTTVPLSTTPAPPGPGGFSGASPVLSVGDHWQETEVSQSNDNGNVTVTYDYIVTGMERVTLDGYTYDAVKVLQHFGPGPQQVLNRTVWNRVGDNAYLKLDEKYSLPGAPPMEHIQISAPPCDSDFPFHVGLVRSHSCLLRDSQSGMPGPQSTTSWRNYTVQVLGIENVSTPAGTFETWRVLTTAPSGSGGTIRDTKWWSPRACNWVREEQETDQGNMTVELQDYRCANGV